MAAKPKATKETKELPTWRVIEIAKKGRYLGTVRAANAEAAIEIAIKAFGVDDPLRHKRLVAQRVE